jgi:hypothetical protein
MQSYLKNAFQPLRVGNVLDAKVFPHFYYQVFPSLQYFLLICSQQHYFECLTVLFAKLGNIF